MQRMLAAPSVPTRALLLPRSTPLGAVEGAMLTRLAGPLTYGCWETEVAQVAGGARLGREKVIDQNNGSKLGEVLTR